MATNKKRKLNTSNELNDISAFAAKSRLRPIENEEVIYDREPHNEAIEDVLKPQDKVDDYLLEAPTWKDSGAKVRVLHTSLRQESIAQSQRGYSDASYLSEARGEDVIPLKKSPASKSRASSAQELEIPFTTVDLTRGSVRRTDGGNCFVEIAAGERLVVLGEYGLSVITGQITILGATLSTSDTVYNVYAPLSHSLPVIRYSISDKNKAEVCLHHKSHGLRSLDQISPLFVDIWDLQPSQQFSAEATSQRQQSSGMVKKSSFHIITSMGESPRQSAYPIVSFPEWNEQLHISTSKTAQSGKAPVIMICGPKASGKSTLARLMVNHLVARKIPMGKSVKSDIIRKDDGSIAFLDLDPGQPEYSPPGQVSLIRLSKPQFGPPYSHPDSSHNGMELLRAHSVAAVSPSTDPKLYKSCMVDLISHYIRKTTENPAPLIINTPGWILGSGLEILIYIIREARPSQILYMSQQGPKEVVESLQEAAGQIHLVTLPSQPTVNKIRTAAQLRKMQYMSYFHLNPGAMTDHLWTASPLVSMAPWQVRYSGDGAGILGVIFLGEPPLSAMVKDTIDGSVLVVVVLDDNAAIRVSGENNARYGDMYQTQSVQREADTREKTQLNIDQIVQTPEGIPYINEGHTTFIDPELSYTLGLALLRGIDSDRKVFHLLTPISEKSIRDTRASGKEVVLISGKLDTPGWAYLEELYDIASSRNDVHEQLESDISGDDSNDSGTERTDWKLSAQHIGRSSEDTPWIEVSRSDRGRGIGARVWRVRRDLGKIVDSK